MIFFTESSPQISNRKGCSHSRIFSRIISPNLNHKGCPLRIFSRIISPNLKSQRVPPLRFFQKIKSPNLKSQGVCPNDFSENQVHSSQNARGVPLRFFRKSNLQISIAMGVPVGFFENHLPKSQIARGVPLKCFRESSSRISHGKGCPPKILFIESSPQFLSWLLVLLYFGGRRYPDSIPLKFGLHYTCRVLRSFNF